MANKKCNTNNIHEMLALYDSGVAVSNLARIYGVHEATIRRYLKSNNRELSKLSHVTFMDYKTKLELQKVLLNQSDISNIICELDKRFIIQLKETDEDEDFKVYQL